MQLSLKEIVSDYVNPFASPVSLNELRAIESVTSIEVYDVYTSIEADSNGLDIMMQSLDVGTTKSEEKFFSKETFGKVMKAIIDKFKLIFAKILVVISNFIKNIVIWISGFAIKKQSEDYELYKNKIITGDFDNVVIRGLPVKNNKVFTNPENITNSLKTFSNVVSQLVNTAKKTTNDFKNCFNNLDSTDSKQFFEKISLGLTGIKVLKIDYSKLMKYVSLQDKDVEFYLKKFELDRQDQINFILKGPKTVANIYIYGEAAFENYKDVLNGIIPVFKKQEPISMKDFIKNTDYNEFNLLSFSSSVKVKQNVNLMKSVVRDITAMLNNSKTTVEDLDVCVTKLTDNMNNGIIKSGFAQASNAIKMVLGVINETRLCNYYSTGIFLSYYSMYLSHRNQLHAAMMKCVEA
jgi:hypothetical protein